MATTLVGMVKLDIPFTRRPSEVIHEKVGHVAFDTRGGAWGLVERMTRIAPPQGKDLGTWRVNYARWICFDALPFMQDERISPEGKWEDQTLTPDGWRPTVTPPTEVQQPSPGDALAGFDPLSPHRDALANTTHRYCDHQTTTSCANDCGAWMGGSRSGGSISGDPHRHRDDSFGECPRRENPPVTRCKACHRLPQENGKPSLP